MISRPTRIVAVVALALAGCSSDLTELVVRIETDYATSTSATDALVSFTLEVAGAGDPVALEPFVVADLPERPWTLAVRPADGVAEDSPVTLTLRGNLPGRSVTDRRLETRFVPGETRFVLLALTQACEGKACATGEACMEDGECAPAFVDPSTLPAWPLSQAAADALPELCNGADDNYNDVVDEGFDTTNNPAHCGACFNACSDDPTGTPICDNGVCGLECARLRGNCETSSDDCEAALDTPAHCGSCDNTCTGATPFCRVTGDTASCSDTECGSPMQWCDDVCIDPQTDPAHCGGCSMACPAGPFSTPGCAGAECILVCDEDYDDCTAAPGCETDLTSAANCGACGSSCAGILGGCMDGACVNPVVDVAVGNNHTCAVFQDGRVSCFGLDDFGQLGPSQPFVIPGTGPVQIAVDDHTSYAVRDSILYRWGADVTVPPTDRTANSDPTPMAGDLSVPVLDVSAGGQRGVLVRRDGADYEVLTWGHARYGGLGDGTNLADCTIEADCWKSPAEIAIPGIGNIVRPTTGPDMSCVTRTGSTLDTYCWGRSHPGGTVYFGDATTDGYSSPTRVSGVYVGIGKEAICTSGQIVGTLRCAGQFSCVAAGGDILTAPLGIPFASAQNLAVGLEFGCALFADDLQCWGETPYSPSRSCEAVAISVAERVTKAAAAEQELCFIISSGQLFCGGDNTHGEAGHGTAGEAQELGQVQF